MRPLFYQNPVALHPAAHGAAGLVETFDYRFARNTNAIPISLSEIPAAALSYPIVFTVDGAVTPVAIVGLMPDQNLFVDAHGAWRSGCYIPAYVRRYPFILAEDPEGQSVQLCVEDDPEVLVTAGGRPLFANGAPSAMTQEAFSFCKHHRAEHLATGPFVEALIACGIVVERTAGVILPDGREIQLEGLAGIEEVKFAALPDEAHALLKRQGWLGAVYAQILSGLNWPRLGDMLLETGT
ncbi:SapC family protein [soil metagenome]